MSASQVGRSFLYCRWGDRYGDAQLQLPVREVLVSHKPWLPHSGVGVSQGRGLRDGSRHRLDSEHTGAQLSSCHTILQRACMKQEAQQGDYAHEEHTGEAMHVIWAIACPSDERALPE